ncbi:MAG TPA: hypothetical protein VIK55_06660 [Paludibacter sp.]
MSKGIDIPIDALLADLNTYLWTANIRSFYGRVFRNVKADSSKVCPEIWTVGNKYIDVLKDSSKDAQCFFDVQPSPANSKDIFTSDVWLCLMLNLTNLYPSLSRMEATDQVQRDVMDLLMSSQFEITGMTGAEGFTGYDWGEDTNVQVKADMSPHYLLKYTLQVTYINT